MAKTNLAPPDSKNRPATLRVQELLNSVTEIVHEQELKIADLRLQQEIVRFDPQTLGATLAEAREQQKITQEDLSMLSGVSRVTIAKLEKGRVNVNFETILKVTDTLGIQLWIGK